MNKRILTLVLSLLMMSGGYLFAADGDLIVNGNVGVGIDPTEKLHVYGGKLRVGDTQIWDNEINRYNNDNLLIGYRNTANTVLQPNGGNVGIGTTSPGAKFDILYGVEWWAARIRNQNGTGYGLLVSGGSGGDGYQVLRTMRYGETTDLFYVTGDGNYYYRGTLLSTRELKRDVSAFNENALDLLKDIKVVSFNYTMDSPDRVQRIGFISNDPQNVYDDRLTNRKVGFDIQSIVGTLIRATQELRKRMVPTGMVAFFPGNCPSGWTENPALTGTITISDNPVKVTACQAP